MLSGNTSFCIFSDIVIPDTSNAYYSIPYFTNAQMILVQLGKVTFQIAPTCFESLSAFWAKTNYEHIIFVGGKKQNGLYSSH